MNILLIGAHGFVGSAVWQEARQRGHRVTALVRSEDKGRALGADADWVVGDARDTGALAALLAQQEVLVSAFNAPAGAHQREAFVSGSEAIIDAAHQAGKRLLVVGGAGSLFVAPGLQLVDTPAFPAEWKAMAEGARDVLNLLQQAPASLDWTLLSPPALLAAGERRGHYRRGRDQLLMDGEQPAGISVADLAVALVDELEQPQARRQRFTVAA